MVRTHQTVRLTRNARRRIEGAAGDVLLRVNPKHDLARVADDDADEEDVHLFKYFKMKLSELNKDLKHGVGIDDVMVASEGSSSAFDRLFFLSFGWLHSSQIHSPSGIVNSLGSRRSI